MDAGQIEALMKVLIVLEKLAIPYVIGGSFASSIHGLARSTNDTDLLALIEPRHVETLASELQEEFYADEQAMKRAVEAGRSFNIIHTRLLFKTDIFAAKATGFDLMQIERRKLESIGNKSQHMAYVATPEDTILAKLVWYRKGNEVSDQQWEDIRGVFKVQGDKLDADYLNHWAEELGVADLLERALGDV